MIYLLCVVILGHYLNIVLISDKGELKITNDFVTKNTLLTKRHIPTTNEFSYNMELYNAYIYSVYIAASYERLCMCILLYVVIISIHVQFSFREKQFGTKSSVSIQFLIEKLLPHSKISPLSLLNAALACPISLSPAKTVLQHWFNTAPAIRLYLDNLLCEETISMSFSLNFDFRIAESLELSCKHAPTSSSSIRDIEDGILNIVYWETIRLSDSDHSYTSMSLHEYFTLTGDERNSVLSYCPLRLYYSTGYISQSPWRLF